MRERKKRKPLISTIALWLFTLGCCQKKKKKNDNGSDDDDDDAVDFRQRRIMNLVYLYVCSWWWKVKLALFDMFQIWLFIFLVSFISAFTSLFS